MCSFQSELLTVGKSGMCRCFWPLDRSRDHDAQGDRPIRRIPSGNGDSYHGGRPCRNREDGQCTPVREDLHAIRPRIAPDVTSSASAALAYLGNPNPKPKTDPAHLGLPRLGLILPWADVEILDPLLQLEQIGRHGCLVALHGPRLLVEDVPAIAFEFDQAPAVGALFPSIPVTAILRSGCMA